MSQDPKHDLLFLLHDVARLIRIEADKRARLDGMTRAQWALLLQLERHPGLSQKEVADLLDVEPISVARLVDRLEAGALIERRPDAADRRIWRLHLRPAAAAAIEKISAQRAELAAVASRNMPQQLRDAMVQGLLQMKANILRLPGTDAAVDLREIA
jgi:DNA-binding MarR family transcriptional regulator